LCRVCLRIVLLSQSYHSSSTAVVLPLTLQHSLQPRLRSMGAAALPHARHVVQTGLDCCQTLAAAAAAALPLWTRLSLIRTWEWSLGPLDCSSRTPWNIECTCVVHCQQ
jgi:hypothetical protein